MKLKKKITALALMSMVSLSSMFVVSNAEESAGDMIPTDDNIVITKPFGLVSYEDEGAYSVSVGDFGFKGSGSVSVTGSGESFTGGGKWTYGLSKINVWSRYVNNHRIHSTKVKNGNGATRSSGDTKPGIHAIASVEKTSVGNKAYVYFK